jgi:hypothetical protein
MFELYVPFRFFVFFSISFNVFDHTSALYFVASQLYLSTLQHNSMCIGWDVQRLEF